MQVFDYEQFLNEYNIDYQWGGRNANKNSINLRCPFCGPDDPSQHFNIDPDRGVYGCWRNKAHSGASAAKFVKQILNCSWDKAYSITNEKRSINLENFGQKISNIFAGQEKREVVELDSSILKPIVNKGAGRVYCKYLQDRGFNDPENLAESYSLFYSLTPDWSQRVIVPVYEDHELVTWVGRSIRQDAKMRYKALTEDQGAMKTTNEAIFMPPGIEKGGENLYIVEGPFDALKLDYYGREYGLRATCLFGLQWSMHQIFLVKLLAGKYNRISILFDSSAYLKSVRLQNDISCHAHIERLPAQVGDPGELSAKQISNMV